MAVKGFIKVNELYCKGCGLCVEVCPQGALHLAKHLTRRGYHPAVRDGEVCTACAHCALVCPDAALTVLREIPASDFEKHAIEKLGSKRKTEDES